MKSLNKRYSDTMIDELLQRDPDIYAKMDRLKLMEFVLFTKNIQD